MELRARASTLPWLLVAAALGLATIGIVAGLLLLALVVCDDDIRRAYPSPERHAHVRLSPTAFVSNEPRRAPRVLHDFDGDGIEDTLSVEYFHMEPLFARSTSGMLRVISGADGSVLVAHATLTPIVSE